MSSLTFIQAFLWLSIGVCIVGGCLFHWNDKKNPALCLWIMGWVAFVNLLTDFVSS